MAHIAKEDNHYGDERHTCASALTKWSPEARRLGTRSQDTAWVSDRSSVEFGPTVTGYFERKHRRGTIGKYFPLHQTAKFTHALWIFSRRVFQKSTPTRQVDECRVQNNGRPPAERFSPLAAGTLNIIREHRMTHKLQAADSGDKKPEPSSLTLSAIGKYPASAAKCCAR
jgi:hypothetical protein